ncbi:hypothetical protein ACIP98_01765 [Streptomyces sp. NPDC088354]|uniref:hypothetical protein n=1 Tax=Streptomyces sp. NPDC088354 TaxID=3365856 RepID=UPI00382C2AB0
MACRVAGCPPTGTGGRRVRIDGTILGIAHSPIDLPGSLRREALFGRRGAGPGVWL